MGNDDAELFELCKQVYEATGWENNIGYRSTILKDSVMYDKIFPRPNEHRLNHEDKDIGTYDECPLYTSDYLLEKLPKEYWLDNFTKVNLFMDSTGHAGGYMYYYSKVGGVIHRYGEGDTPIKALLKLTLALKEAGEI